ncbi:hypothetical protein BU17DRAFT_83996 [Hysterangium stoloniferum]|nr:hypothetical protein BU17DRAFT_83996 [Hysterangium stoloniferum]
MVSVISSIWRGVLPVLVFGFLSVSAFKYLLLQVIATEPLSRIEEQCPIPFQGESLVQLHYLGGILPGVENVLCVLVAFFYSVLQPKQAPSPWLTDTLAALGACVVVPFVESSRAKTPFFFGFPVLMGLLYQTNTVAVIFPVFWIILIVFGTTHSGGVGSQISQAKAEGVLVGLLLGYYLPTIAMVLYATPLPIALWQVFPVCMAITNTTYNLLRSKRAHQRSGYGTIQSVYIIIFIISTFAHVSLLRSHGFSVQRIIDASKSAWNLPTSPDATVADVAVHFLQWDVTFLFVSSVLASLWFARNPLQAFGILAWYAGVTLTLGPGAALSTVFMWRELGLKNTRMQLAAIKAKTK